MKTVYYHVVILLLVIFVYSSCTKEEDVSSNSTSSSSIYFGNSISIKARGQVVDQFGSAVEGAIVRAGNKVDTTDIHGVFQLNNFAAYEKSGCVTVEKAGYFKGVRNFIPLATGNELKIRLLTRTNVGTIVSANGGTVTTTNASLTLSANTVQLNNAPYNGVINVAMRHISPESATFFEEIPGGLTGIDESDLYALKSYGMVAVELTDNNGQKLQISPGQTATVKFTVPPSLIASAPATIDLWSLDETLGVWKKEGAATLDGNTNEYIAQVSHFSFWNCDVSLNPVNIDGMVVYDQTSQPVAGAIVELTSSSNGLAQTITNAAGWFSGIVPENEVFTIKVYTSCNGVNNVVYTGSIGPFSSATTISNIIIPLTATIYGNVLDCNNNPIANSYVLLNGNVIFTNNGYYNCALCGNSFISGINPSPYLSSGFANVIATGVSQNLDLVVCINPNSIDTVNDVDGNTYNVIQIGAQYWMQENLKTTHYNNGTPITTGLTNADWQSNTSGAYSEYNNNSNNSSTYGNLYNWYAVANPAGLCPTGWHVPTNSEWMQLDVICGGGDSISGGYLKEVGLTHWASPNFGATNATGFTALPGGSRLFNGPYSYMGYNGNWWAATDYSQNTAYYNHMLYGSAALLNDYTFKSTGHSVRCIKN